VNLRSQFNLAAKQKLKVMKRLPRFPRAIAPRQIEREYERAIVGYLDAYRGVVETHVLHRLEGFAAHAYLHRPGAGRTDAADDILGSFNGIPIALSKDFTEDDLRKLALQFGYSVSEFNEKILKRGFKDVLGIDIFLDEPYLENELLMFAANNANLISKLTDETTEKIQFMVFDGFRQGRRASDISDDIEQYIDPEDGPVRSRAALIARDQTNKLNGQLTQLRQTNLGVERYTWRTMLDERVRDEHEENEGEVFDWDDPPSTGHPGDDIQCRCYAEPMLDDVLDEDEDEDSESEDQND
jgi:SPP1 gp7 family putative phage head morphogenesis protein